MTSNDQDTHRTRGAARSDDATPRGTYHCPACRRGYDGWHHCPEGPDRVEYECIDCEEHVNREQHSMDIDGIVPSRCSSCTLARMAEQ